MAHVELQLISNIIEQGDWRTVHSTGTVPDHFLTEDGHSAFRWLFDEVKKDGAVPSKTRFMRKFPQFEFCPSRDPISAQLRELRSNNIRSEALQVLEDLLEKLESGDEDPEEALQLHIPQLRDTLVEFSDSGGSLLSRAAEEMRADYDAMKHAGGIVGISYPWGPLNEETGGLQPGQFVVIFARPKMMKTWVACAIAVHAYLGCGKRVAVYSKEMTVKQMRRRCASIVAKMDDGEIRTGSLSPEDEDHFFDVLADLEDLEQTWTDDTQRKPGLLFLSDKGVRGGSTIDSLRARIEKFEPDLLVVDGFYLMRDARSGKKDRDWKTVGNVSADIKELALEMDLPIIGTCQANRAAAQNKGGSDLSDIAFADAIGQDADIVMQVVKGRAPEGHPMLMFMFPGVRDGDMSPFVINAIPGKDFSLRSATVNVKEFFENAEKLDGRSGDTAPAPAPQTPAHPTKLTRGKTRLRK